jgi:glycine cleavage system H protein
MDGFSYVNIFETKGIEYLVIIAFLLLLIPFWLLLNKKAKLTHEIRKTINFLSVSILNTRPGLFYSKNHTWTHLEKSGSAKVGLDDFLLQITGEVKINYLKREGEMIHKDDLIAAIDQKGKHLRIFSPVSGEILKINPLIIEDPEIINSDPYDDGWICSIKPSNWQAETNSYFLGEEATAWLKKELERIKDFLAMKGEKYYPGVSAIMLQDGGELCQHLLSDLPEGLWHEFQQEFLDPEELKLHRKHQSADVLK